jgi:L1 cell adhesion molecule like protein
MKSTLGKDTVKLAEADKKKMLDAMDDGLRWLESNQTATKDEFEDQLKTLTGIMEPFVKGMYGDGDGKGPVDIGAADLD